MGTITLSVPDELKEKMSRTDWINWSSVARHAFSDALKDMEELQLRRKVRELSEIADDDRREVKESVFKEFVKSVEKTSEELKSGKRKAMSIEEFNELCEKL